MKISQRSTLLALPVILLLAPGVWAVGEEKEPRTVRATVQLRPGGPVEEVDMPVHESPVDPRAVPADEADLAPDDLVLGVVEDGCAMAWPIRYLALYEVVNDRVAELPVAPTW